MRQLLDRDYNVRGTVRSIARATELNESLAQFGEKWETTVVGDIAQVCYHISISIEVVRKSDGMQLGAFDHAVQGVHAVVHMASPVTLNVDDPDGIDFLFLIIYVVHISCRRAYRPRCERYGQYSAEYPEIQVRLIHDEIIRWLVV